MLLQVPTARRNEVMQTAARARPRPAQPLRRQDQRTRGVVEVWRDTKAVFSAPLRDLHQVWDRSAGRSPGSATTRPAPTPSTRRPGRADDPGLHVHVVACRHARRQRRPAPAIVGAPAQGGHPARAGRQLARRDGLRLHQAGFDAFDVHMTDLQAGRARLGRLPGLRRLRRLQLRRHAGRRHRLGPPHPLQPGAGRRSSRLLRAPRHLRARRVQRLPDVGRAGRHHPGRRGLAALHHQPQRALRGAPVAGRGAGVARLFFAGMAGSRLPIAVAHGEGYANFSQRGDAAQGASRRCASSTTTASRPRPIRSTRTAAPAA